MLRHLIGLSLGVAVLSAAGTSTARAEDQATPTPLRVAASSFASVEIHLNARRIDKEWFEEDASLTGPSRIAIVYGQPHARGRRVEGGLVPVNEVWRLGANAATTLHTDVDLTLGTVKLAPGDYSLFMLYSGTSWQLIVNGGTGRWGTDRDPARDIGRVALTSRMLSQPEESLSIYLIPQSSQPASGYADLQGVLKIRWGATELTAEWRIER